MSKCVLTSALSPWNFGDKPEIILIIHSEKDDKLEIGFKDKHGRVDKPTLEVKKGWAGYKISFDQFKKLDWNKIEMIQIAHTLHLRGEESNRFQLVFSVVIQ